MIGAGNEPVDPAAVRALLLHYRSEAVFGVDTVPGGGPLPQAEPAESPMKLRATATPPPAATSQRSIDAIAERIAACTSCGLCETRTKTVPGQGGQPARLLFIGEAPGYHEDQQGLAFVGKAGQLLTKMISAMGLERDEVFIANILKCRPPDNRDPRPEEVNRCFPFLLDQIDALQPEVICCLGRVAANNLLERDESMARLRGRTFDFRGIKVVPTYHPSYLLRSPAEKRKAWEDLQVVMGHLGLQ